MSRVAPHLFPSFRRAPAYWAVALATVIVAGVAIPTAVERLGSEPSVWLTSVTLGAGLGLALAVSASIVGEHAVSSRASIVRTLAVIAVGALAAGAGVFAWRLLS